MNKNEEFVTHPERLRKEIDDRKAPHLFACCKCGAVRMFKGGDSASEPPESREPYRCNCGKRGLTKNIKKIRGVINE